MIAARIGIHAPSCIARKNHITFGYPGIPTVEAPSDVLAMHAQRGPSGAHDFLANAPSFLRATSSRLG